MGSNYEFASNKLDIANLSLGEVAKDVLKICLAETDCFYTHCIDYEGGGFCSDFDSTWCKKDSKAKSLVFQSRMVWVAAEMAKFMLAESQQKSVLETNTHITKSEAGHIHSSSFIPRGKYTYEDYICFAKHGMRFLIHEMFDNEYGGLKWLVNANGNEVQQKHLYGMAFAIYAASNTYEVTGDETILDFAKNLYYWIEDHASDQINGGYFEFFERDGTPILKLCNKYGGADYIGTPIGCKSLNTHLHLLEAYTSLLRVWPDEHLQVILHKLVDLFNEKMFVLPGYLNQVYQLDWTIVSGDVSYGHDVEAAYLLIESAELLGEPILSRVKLRALKLINHSIEVGCDHDLGGMYESGSSVGTELDKTKTWWVQAEFLNALIFADSIDRNNGVYINTFLKTWQFVSKFCIDREHHGWWWSVDKEGQINSDRDKVNQWKAPYHTARSLLNIYQLLSRRLKLQDLIIINDHKK
ncbi:AGE family epimerase/isomerase [Planctomycetota bacterium]|nr:AGE family epimerase/isomerase [Planctomycetota bacterium]